MQLILRLGGPQDLVFLVFEILFASLCCSARGISTIDFCAMQGGDTALMWAAQKGRVDCVRLLLDAGADKELVDNVRRMICYEVSALFFSG